VDDKEKMAVLREEVMSGLTRLLKENAIPEQMSFYTGFIKMWEEKKFDVIFRGAPHLLVTSTPKSAPSPIPDCLIAMSYFELFAQANGVGTVWDGLAKMAIDDLLPETRQRLGIPDDHLIGYAMVFGKPAVNYARTVQRGAALIHRAM
jgi:nitroreductase